MASFACDTLKFTRRLRNAGVPEINRAMPAGFVQLASAAAMATGLSGFN